MNKYFIHSALSLAVVGLLLFSCIACSTDDEDPQIDSIWRNMTSEPIAQVGYAYPGQTLCLRGHGFSGLKQIDINGTLIDVQNTLIYDTDESITFQVPTDVTTSYDENLYYLTVITNHGQTTYRPFRMKMRIDKPTITKFSSTILVAGSRLTITGTNLDGVTQVLLPTVFEQQVPCQLAPATQATATEVSVIVPEGVTFAKGQVEIVMQKADRISGDTYEERTYSAITNFTN